MKKRTMRNEIDHITDKLKDLDPSTPEYTSAVKNLKELCESKKITSINFEFLIGAGLTLVEIILVLRFERFDVITSKAFSRIKSLF